MKRYRFTIEFRDYWHVGSGRGQGKHLDAVVDKDPDGLPFIPGRMLKGLLRDAVYRLESWGNIGKAKDGLATKDLFGDRSGGELSRHEVQPGRIFVGDARLPESLRLWLAHPDQATQRQALYRQIFSTAIDEVTGGAREKSLRGIEVVVPVTLTATLEIQGEQPDLAQACLARALPLIQSMGAHRSRGLGRARLVMEEAA